MVEPMHQTSAEYPYGVDELSKVGLTPLKSEKVRPPRVKESPVHFECRVHSLVEIGDGTQGSVTLVIAQVLKTHVMAEAIHEGRVDLEKILPVSRLGGEFYGLAPDYFRLPRPKGEA
jgi:flavin reductase (DIM6/NTAB) family NADH-FMN oxidoreductase RutF